MCFYFVWLKTSAEIPATGNTLLAIIASQQCSAAAEREVKPFSVSVQNKDQPSWCHFVKGRSSKNDNILSVTLQRQDCFVDSNHQNIPNQSRHFLTFEVCEHGLLIRITLIFGGSVCAAVLDLLIVSSPNTTASKAQRWPRACAAQLNQDQPKVYLCVHCTCIQSLQICTLTEFSSRKPNAMKLTARCYTFPPLVVHYFFDNRSELI